MLLARRVRGIADELHHVKRVVPVTPVFARETNFNSSLLQLHQ
jgi:hypothetical protein